MEKTPAFFRIQLPALIVGVLALGLCAVAGIFNHEQFFRSYLLGWVFVLGISLGSMAIVMLHYLTGGAWGILLRRIGEAAAGTLPFLLILFIPIAFGLHHLYPWARPETVAAEAVLQHRKPVFNPQFVLIRVAIYFLVWIFWAWRLRRLSLAHDRNSDPQIEQSLATFSAAGLVIYFITMSLASVDLILSREVHWYSSIFGFLIIVGQSLSGLAFMLIVLARLSDDPPLHEVTQPDTVHDLGNLTLTMVILWAYISLSQFLIIWMGNTQEEIPWYLHRSQGFWMVCAVGLIVLHFFVPFLLLLVQNAKRNIKILGAIAAGIFLLRFIDVLWIIEPTSESLAAHGAHWMDLLAPIGIGGIWLFVFILRLKARPLIPLGEQIEVDIHGAHASTS